MTGILNPPEEMFTRQPVIESFRNAARVADFALQAGLKAIKEGASYTEIENITRKAAMQAGANPISQVNVSGRLALTTVKGPLNATAADLPGEIISLEILGWCEHYGFHASRVAMSGKPASEQEDTLNHAAEATEWMIGELKPGRKFRFTMTESRGRKIEPRAHGIGLEIYADPRITVDKEFTLMPGMVICVEPILTSPKFGEITIAEMVLITETGAEVLTCCPRRTWE